MWTNWTAQATVEMRTLAKIILPVVIVAVAIASFAYLRATRPQATPAPVQEKVWPVAAVTAKLIDIRPSITEFGTIVAGRQSFSVLRELFEHHLADELVRHGQGLTIWVVE